MPADVLPNSIVRYPAPGLRKKCAPVDNFDQSVSALAQRMLQIMRENVNPTGQPEDNRVYVNPVLSDLTGVQESEEGCLSVPDVHVAVRRANKCKIKAFDAAGKPFEQQGEGLLARVWQHESDHLNGVLIVDRMNATDQIANKKAIAHLEEQFAK